MNKKNRDSLATAKTWLEKHSGSETDIKPVSHALEAAEKAAQTVADLRGRLVAASKEESVSFLVLQETIKSAKHAQKAIAARQKSTKNVQKGETKPAATEKPKAKSPK